MENKVFPRILDHDGTVSMAAIRPGTIPKLLLWGAAGAVAAANSLACLAVFIPALPINSASGRMAAAFSSAKHLKNLCPVSQGRRIGFFL